MSKTSTYINPLTDFGFKYIFGQEYSKPFLISFLNAVFKGEDPIDDVQFLDKEKVRQHKNGRSLIYDLHCHTTSGKTVIVEMQNRYQTNFAHRALYYLSVDIASQAPKGDDWNYELTPVYGIFMMNFEWRDVKDQHLREDICLINTQTGEKFSDLLRMTFFKIPMMTKDAGECDDTLEKWIYLMKNMEKMDTMPTEFMKDPVFKRLEEVTRVIALDEEDRRDYERSLKIYRDNYAIAETERTIGREEGRAEGRAEGKSEEKSEIAANLLKMGATEDFIAKATGLSITEIAAIRTKL